METVKIGNCVFNREDIISASILSGKYPVKKQSNSQEKKGFFGAVFSMVLDGTFVEKITFSFIHLQIKENLGVKDICIYNDLTLCEKLEPMMDILAENGPIEVRMYNSSNMSEYEKACCEFVESMCYDTFIYVDGKLENILETIKNNSLMSDNILGKISKNDEDVNIDNLKKYKKLLEDGIITEEEFTQIKKKILNI